MDYISSSTSNNFGIIDFGERVFYDEEFPVYTEMFQLFSNRGTFLDTVLSFNQFGLHLNKSHIFYGLRDRSGFEFRLLGSDFNFLIPESEEIKYHSFQDSLFMFISYTSEKQGKPGFKQILDRQETEMQEFRDSVKAWASELDKIKPETRLQYEQKKKAEKTLREKVLEERKKSEQFYKSERNRFNIRDVWKAQLVVLDPLNREIQVNTKLALPQPDNFLAGSTAYNDRSITAQVPAAISSSFIATIIKDVNKKETVSIFDREGNRLHEVSASDFNYVHTIKIIQDTLLFTMSGGGKFDVIDLSTGEFIWRKRSSSYNRYRLLERQTSAYSEILYLYARERTNKGSSFSEAIKSFNLKCGKLETIYNLSEVKK